MTRRVVKPQPEQDTDCPYHIGTGIERKARICPYGKPGDRLWVRETFGVCDFPGGSASFGKRKILYKADGETTYDIGKWKPSIFMPRMYSRITLEITSVRVERLQDISNKDIESEGACGMACVTHRLTFKQLWDSINSKRGYSWESNPWVWVVEFERIKEQGRGQ